VRDGRIVIVRVRAMPATQPFTVRIDERLLPDGSELIEFICNENQQFLKRVKVQ
jgi:hypothetical protein